MARLTWPMLPIFAGALLGEAVYLAAGRGPWFITFKGKRIVLDKAFGRINWANIRNVPRELVGERNVVAFLRTIRQGESSQTADAYRMMNGRELFTAPPWIHPRRKGKGGTSTAAGAYQFVVKTWDGLVKEMALADFSPAAQDLAALGHIAWLGALPDVISGNTRAAYAKCSMKSGWTSLPGGPENPQTAAAADAVFVRYGGVLKGK